MLLGGARIFLAIQIGNRFRRCTRQSPANPFRNRLVVVVLLHPSGCGVERRILAVAKDDLADDTQSQGVATRTVLDEP